MEKYVNHINILSYNKSNRKLEMLCTTCGTKFYRHQTTYSANWSTICKPCNNRLIAKSNKTHGHSRTRLYNIWCGIIKRCENKNEDSFKYYGGRGISICREWRESYQIFETWSISNGYTKDLTIDRIDVNGNYEPSNCRWTTRFIQSQNQRTRNDNKLGHRCISICNRNNTVYVVQVQRFKKRFASRHKDLNEAIEYRDFLINELDSL